MWSVSCVLGVHMTSKHMHDAARCVRNMARGVVPVCRPCPFILIITGWSWASRARCSWVASTRQDGEMAMVGPPCPVRPSCSRSCRM